MKFFNCSPFYFAFLYPACLLITVGKLCFTILLCTTSSIISNLVVFPVYGIDTRFDKLYRRLLNLYVFKRPMKCVPYQNNCFGFNSQYYYHLVTFVYVWHPRFELISFCFNNIIIQLSFVIQTQVLDLIFVFHPMYNSYFTHVTLFSFLLYTSTAV